MDCCAAEICDFVQKTPGFLSLFCNFANFPMTDGENFLCRICKKFGRNHLNLWFLFAWIKLDKKYDSPSRLYTEDVIVFSGGEVRALAPTLAGEKNRKLRRKSRKRRMRKKMSSMRKEQKNEKKRREKRRWQCGKIGAG